VFLNLIFLLVGWFASLIYFSQSNPTSHETAQKVDVDSSSVDVTYLSALEKLLLEYEDKLSSLQDVNKLLQAKLSLTDSKKTLISVVPSFRKKIQHMSENEVKEELYTLFRHKHQLKNVDSYKDFALNFVDLALKEDKLPENIEDGNHLIDVRISISKNSVYIDVSEDNFQASKYHKLYANISASPALKNVMLKWKNLTTGELLKYQVIGTAAENDILYVWARPSSGWEVGTYQVSLHKLDNAMTLISQRLYRINSVIDEGPEPTNQGIPLQRG